MFQIPKAATCYHGKNRQQHVTVEKIGSNILPWKKWKVYIGLYSYDLKQLESSEELIDQRNIVFLSVPKRGL